MTSGDSERLISLLKNAIRLSNFTYRDVERQLGWRVGTITRLMRGGLGLKVEYLLSILRVIQFSPARFFAAAFPIPEPSALDAYGPGAAAAHAPSNAAAEDRLYRMLEQMYGDPAAMAGASRHPQAPSKQDDIDEMVRLSLRKLMAAGGTGAGADLEADQETGSS